MSVWDIKVGDNFVADGISTGAVDFIARYLSIHRPDGIRSDYPIRYREWELLAGLSAYGMTEGIATEGICGAPLVDENGRVGGVFRYIAEETIFATTPPMDYLMLLGWTVV